jgi:hypothetical protein
MMEIEILTEAPTSSQVKKEFSTYARVSYTGQRMKRLLKTPPDVPALLANLKLIMDRSLLLQPTFFSDEILRRAFSVTNLAGSTAGIDQSSNRVAHSVELAVAIKPGMTVAQVERVFGVADVVALDDGIGSEGHSSVPQSKGRMSYQKREPLTGTIESRYITFVIRRDDREPRHIPGRGSPGETVFKSTDTIQSITMYEQER